MPNTPDAKPSPSPAIPPCVVLVHAAGAAAPSAEWVESVTSLGHRVFSPGGAFGCEPISAPVSRLGEWCGELEALAPGHAVLLLRASLLPAPWQVEALLQAAAGAAPQVVTVLSNADPVINPFAGLDAGAKLDARADLVRQWGEQRLHSHPAWPRHLALLNAAAVSALAESGAKAATAPGELASQGGAIEVAEWLYVHDPASAPSARPRQDPHDTERPRPWGSLARRLAGAKPAPDPRPIEGPVTLHVTHSWGGGVAQWLQSFIEADNDGPSLQLRAEGPQSGAGAGQCLALYRDNDLDHALGRWWLDPPIDPVCDHHPQVAEVLERIIAGYGVGRVIVSSLVGHSLDVLRTGLPTVQVLHDHFPAWPLLSVDPARHDHDLETALRDAALPAEFSGLTARQWQVLAARYAAAVQEGTVLLAAPSAATAALHKRLLPTLESHGIALIPHGLPPLPGVEPVPARPRDDGRLRLVVPGRMQSLKGARLLLEALPELTRHAHLTLLGTGKGGEAFFGQSGVDVVLEYRRDELPGLLRAIGPHVAGLLSVVPETFSYTLSEMKALGVPVIASRLGSLAERVAHNEDGWLIEPTAQALVDRVAGLAQNPGSIETARAALAHHPSRSCEAMVADYATLCPGRAVAAAPIERGDVTVDRTQISARDDEWCRLDGELRGAQGAIRALEQENRRRADWAEGVKRELADEVRRREVWVDRLEQDIDQLQGHLRDAQRQQDRLQREMDGLQSSYDALQETHKMVLNSSSWRLTRPLRAARRLVGNFLRARAWNPLRWPLLLSQLVRNLSTVGVGGTLVRLQQGAHTAPPPHQALPDMQIDIDAPPPKAVPAADAPVVSVIIPVYNQLPYTLACLRSLAETPAPVALEIIVVDDASDDDSKDVLHRIEGLIYRRNDRNLGFIGSCNRGAETARGEFLFFLNNDTRVTDHWLAPLLDVFENIPDAGLVGSRLVYPDGRLQECGGLVFRDGSGWNYGRGDDPDRPPYQALRETDYCSGAALMIRRSTFAELGGFDARYAPAYYEDTDLAFSVRDAGLKVFVQPASTIVHDEGVTSGTDLNSGTKQYQAVNQATFTERWAEALERQPRRIENPDDAPAVCAARDHRLHGRVLVVDAHTPEPDQDSGSVRLTRLMRCLMDLGYGVDFLPDNRAYAGRYTRALQALGVTCWYSPEADSLADFLAAQGDGWDLVIVSRHYVAVNYLAAVRKHCPRARFVFDTVDLHYLREQRLAELEDSLPLRRVAQQTRRSELAVVEAADATLVVSPVEIEVLADDAPEATVRLLSNIHELSASVTPYAERKDLFFVGGYQHPPNIDAVTWFVRDIWPLVRAELPEAEFHIVGSKAPDRIRKLAGDGVVYHGFAESLDPFLDGCRLAVAPLRYGAGVKGKVNHSMAHGQPVVATPMATEGMHAEPGRDVMVAETAEDFAQAVVRTYSDEALWNRLSSHGRDNVATHFSMDAARRQLQALIDELGSN